MSVSTDPTSTVGDNYWVRLAFTPTSTLPSGGKIVISPISVKLKGSNCVSLILESSLTAAVTCDYSSNTVTIVTGNSVSNPNQISFKIDKALYNTQMSPKTISVELWESDLCKIEQGSNAVDWKPANPATFTSLAFGILATPNTVCSSGALMWDIRPKLAIAISQLIVLEVVDGPTRVGGSLTITGLTSGSSGLNTVRGLTGGAWPISATARVSAYYFTLPSTEKSFSAKVTTYAGNSETATDIVHQQTVTVTSPAVKSALPFT